MYIQYLYCTLFEVRGVADSLRRPSFLPAVLYPPNKVCLELRKKRFSSQVFGNVQLGDQKIRQKYTKIHQFLVPYLLYREDQQQQERKHAFTVTQTVLLSSSPAFSNFTSSCGTVICRSLVAITESLESIGWFLEKFKTLFDRKEKPNRLHGFTEALILR
jgi:hypothetical protein